jgi:RNA polymerase sigma-70 factor (ECF subfamily)
MSDSRSSEEAAARHAAAEALLVSRIGVGERRALFELYDRYSGMLLALARRILSDSSVAEQVLQEVFIKVWNDSGRYDPARLSVATWLVLITRRCAIDRLEKSSVGGRAVSTWQSQEPVKPTAGEALEDGFPLDRQARVVRRLQTLPAEERRALELVFYEGLTLFEISERANAPLGTVKSRLLSAAKRLREALVSDSEEPTTARLSPKPPDEEII